MYGFCLGYAPIPAELQTLRAIEQFGVRAVMGRDELTYREATGMRLAGMIHKLYQEREASGAWAEWINKHPKESKVLEAAQRIWQTTH